MSESYEEQIERQGGPAMNACLLLHTCDAYSHLWESCVTYFDRHVKWPWPKFIATEEQGVLSAVVDWTVIRTGRGEWSDRLRVALEWLSHYDFTFYMQEDVWAKGDIWPFDDPKCLQEPLDCLHVQPECRYYKYYQVLGLIHETGGIHVNQFAPDSPYLMNHKPGWWRREFLLKYLTPGQDPWTNEREATKQMQADGVGNRIGLIECDWYDDVCRRGELTDVGKQRLIGRDRE